MFDLILGVFLLISFVIIVYLITELNIAKEEYKFLQTRIEYELKIRRLDDTRGKA